MELALDNINNALPANALKAALRAKYKLLIATAVYCADGEVILKFNSIAQWNNCSVIFSGYALDWDKRNLTMVFDYNDLAARVGLPLINC